MKRLLIILVLLGLAYAATGIYFVGPDELVVVRRCGAMLAVPSGPGAHLGLPWCWEQRDRLRPGEVRRVTFGPRAVASAASGDTAAQFLTGDRNLINIQSSVQFTVHDPGRYLFQTATVDTILEQTGLAVLAEQICGEPVDRLLTSGKQEVAVQLRQELQTAVDRYGLGITIRSVDLRLVQPPPDVAPAFHDVVAAMREKQQTINEANSYARSTVARATAEAQRLRDDARAYHDRTIREAEAEASVFSQLVVEYRRAPELTAKRLYLETITQTLPRFRAKLIVAGDTDLDLSIIGEEGKKKEELPSRGE